MKRRNKSCYADLRFDACTGVFDLPSGDFTVDAIRQVLRQHKIENFAGKFLGDNHARIFSLLPNSRAVIVKVTAPRPCFLTESFMENAQSAGFWPLGLAAGPFVATADLTTRFPSIIVMTKSLYPFAERVSNPPHWLWRVLSPPSGSRSIVVVEGVPRIEGEKFIAFSPNPPPE